MTVFLSQPFDAEPNPFEKMMRSSATAAQEIHRPGWISDMDEWMRVHVLLERERLLKASGIVNFVYDMFADNNFTRNVSVMLYTMYVMLYK